MVAFGVEPFSFRYISTPAAFFFFDPFWVWVSGFPERINWVYMVIYQNQNQPIYQAAPGLMEHWTFEHPKRRSPNSKDIPK